MSRLEKEFIFVMTMVFGGTMLGLVMFGVLYKFVKMTKGL